MKGDGGGEDESGDQCCPTVEESDEQRPASGRFDLGSLIEVLSHRTRREVLAALETRDREMTLDELTEQINGPCTVTDPLRRSRDPHERVKLQLYHVHLPKLAGEGLVTFDRRAGTVAITEDGEAASRWSF